MDITGLLVSLIPFFVLFAAIQYVFARRRNAPDALRFSLITAAVTTVLYFILNVILRYFQIL